MTRASADGDRIAGLSIPKAGTHLLVGMFKSMGYTAVPHPKGNGLKILDGLRLPERSPLYVYGHWRYSSAADARLSAAGFRKIVLIRDPRDICLSMADFIKSGRAPGVVEREPALVSLPLKALQLMVIEGMRHSNYRTSGIVKICEGWLPWADHGAVLLKYEEIGDDATTGRSIDAVQAIGLDPAAFGRVGAQRFKPKPRRQRWETEFDDELHAAWRRHAAGVAARLGYAET